MLRKNYRIGFYKHSILFIYFSVFMCFITIGYAALSTAFEIGGTTSIAGSTWDVHFVNIRVLGSAVTTELDVIGNTSIQLNEIKLNPPNYDYKFLVDVVNEGTVDAKIKNIVIPTVLSNFEIMLTYKNGTEVSVNDLLKAGTKETLLVALKYKENSLPGEINQSIRIDIDYVQADELAKKPSTSEFTTTSLINLSNGVSTPNSTNGIASEMYAFEHEATDQLEANVDYRYIGGAYCIYDGGKKYTTLSNGTCRNMYKYQATAISESVQDKVGYSTTCPSNDDNYTYSCEEIQGEKKGVEPNNYIDFNGETWRIIGAFPTDNGNGTIENRLKIVKDEPILDTKISYDYKKTGVGSSTTDYGSNLWTDAQLMYFLNPDDIGANARNKGYTYENNLVKDTKGTVIYELGKLPAEVISGATTYGGTENTWRVSADALTKVDSVKYYLGSIYYNAKTAYGTAEGIYIWERGRKNSSISTEVLSWTGKVALMYASDYVYTFAKGINDICFDNAFICKSSNGGIPQKSWLYRTYYQWLITNDEYSSKVYYLNGDGRIQNYYNTFSQSIHPVVYLKPDVKLIGSGTIDDHYVIVE